jgi:Zn-dependent hydrolases, including glyoxylases
MQGFQIEKLSERVTRIYAFSTELMYLVEGDEKAALLDTGSGIGSLKACIQKLTDKPVIVLHTHGHVDHALGASEFEEIYMNRLDDYIYKEHSKMEFRKAGLVLSPYQDEITEKDIIPAVPCDAFRDLKGGMSFDLGGATVEIYDCPGHTKGSVVMLLKEERALLLGDACNTFTFLFDDYSLTVEEYEKSLEKLKEELEGKYDTVYLSHRGGNGSKNMIQEVIQVCKDIKNQNVDDIPFEFMGAKAFVAKAVTPEMLRADGVEGNIVYRKERIFM